MKNIFVTVVIILITMKAFGQQINADKWNELAKTNIGLLPMYGHAPKTDGQKNSDKEFIEIALKKYPSNRKASDHLIELGFKYLYTDIKTAMYRFNQAYLLDSTNTDIFGGYGGVYMTLGDYQKAQQQYTKGLSLDSKNTNLLTDYGTYFMAHYFEIQNNDKKNALTQLDSAISYLGKSYQIDNKNPNTTFKLSVCYFQKKDCKNAWKYYDECVIVGGQPITEEFTKALNEQCKKIK